MYHIHTNKCNLEYGIAYTQNIMLTQHDVAHIYTNQHLITILVMRLQWLWQQHHVTVNQPHILEAPTEPFETKLV